ncbi:PREDICTED: non-functional pseudokinase ZED1-like isoform X1 [Prunus mume]|uniref:Non-functional pseudokinase ZED1-like isoform X1 n=1 Tax=Prunus mume TaxID=102107 RepID=A0ABM0P9L7_PRUMU|nr:PREDICTED: non-functional pseudokinase ZED1-like isoform X1 [Prunus mume]
MSCQFLLSLLPCLRKVERDTDNGSSFLKNGSMLLENLIASCGAKFTNPIRTYSADELIRATNNFDPSCMIDGGRNYQMFRGFLDGRSIVVKKFMWENYEDEARSLAICDIIISMQVSNHNNVLKLLGCCLEFPVPALVHENAAKGVLNSRGGLGPNDQSLLPWKTRLRIAKQLANVLTYLHTAFPRTIIHRSLTPSCIFLDHDFVPKLSNFSLSVTIPRDVTTVRGTLGYLDPAYRMYFHISEKTDVYGLGMLLLVFLTGQREALKFYLPGDEQNIPYASASDGQIQETVDPKIFEEVGEDEKARQDLHDFTALALLCTRYRSELRPDMIDVAKELMRIEKSMFP